MVIPAQMDEVRPLGRLLLIPAPLVQRHPFHGPGLAIRILTPITHNQVGILPTSRRNLHRRDRHYWALRRDQSSIHCAAPCQLRLLVLWVTRGVMSKSLRLELFRVKTESVYIFR